MKSLKYLFLFVVALFSTTVVLSSCGDDDEDLKPILKTDYDVIQINGESYACYGHRCPITYASDWDLSSHRGRLILPCGKLSDAQKEEYGDMIAFGIVDPAKVTRIALEGASSISGLLITSECVITEKVEEKAIPPMPASNPAGGYGMDDFM